VYPQRTATAKAVSYSRPFARFLALERCAFSHPHRFAVRSPVPTEDGPIHLRRIGLGVARREEEFPPVGHTGILKLRIAALQL